MSRRIESQPEPQGVIRAMEKALPEAIKHRAYWATYPNGSPRNGPLIERITSYQASQTFGSDVVQLIAKAIAKGQPPESVLQDSRGRPIGSLFKEHGY